MAEPETQAPAPEEGLVVPQAIGHALSRFAYLLRRTLLIETAAWLVFLLICFFTVFALADRFLFLTDGWRSGLALVGYAAALGLGVFLIRRALRPYTPAEIALALESRAQFDLHEELISTTVELAERKATEEGISYDLMECVALEAEETLKEINVDALPDLRGVKRAAKFAGVLVGLALVLCLIPGLMMPAFYLRAFTPWLNWSRPARTQIAVLTGNRTIAQGERLDIEVNLTGDLPDECFVEAREGKASWQRLRMASRMQDAARFDLTVGPLHVPMQYRVRAGDGLSEMYAIRVLPRPEVAGLKVTVQYPKYAEMPDLVMDHAAGDLAILKGSTVKMEVQASTPLSAAALEFSDERTVSMEVVDAKATVGFLVDKDSSYKIRLRSMEKVGNPEPPLFSIRAVADRPPVVEVAKPVSEETVDPAEFVNLEVRAEDDLRIERMNLVVRSATELTARTLPLSRPKDAKRVWILSQTWDVGGLFPNSGETVTYVVEAVDSNNQTGRCKERRLRIAAGVRGQQHRLLEKLEIAQQSLIKARGLFQTAAKDARDLAQLFRPDDLNTRAGERLLVEQSYQRAGQELKGAAVAVREAATYAEGGTFRQLLEGLDHALERYASSDLGMLQESAQQVRSASGAAVQQGLRALDGLVPDCEKRIQFYHEALTAGHRYGGGIQMADRAGEIRTSQKRLTPVLIGSAGWTESGHVQKGLLGDYHRGTNFDALVRRAVDTRPFIQDTNLPQVGTDNYSVRWSGQVAAPKAGKYVFRVTADDGVRLTVAGKKLADAWRTQAATPYDGEIELKEGWHDIAIEYYQGGGQSMFKLERSGPGLKMDEIPPDQLRTFGAPLVGAPSQDVASAMGKAASKKMVEDALTRLRSLVAGARGLPTEYQAFATLPPIKDDQGVTESKAYDKEVSGQTAPLGDLDQLSPSVALPLAAWNDQCQGWSDRYTGVRERYRRMMEEYARRLAADVYQLASRARELSERAQEAQKTYQQLANDSRNKQDPQRTEKVATETAVLKAEAQNLEKQADRLAHDLREASRDSARTLEERAAFQALAEKAEDLAKGPIEEMAKQIEKAPDLAAKAEQDRNFERLPQAAADKARELAQQTEAVEKTARLRDALKEEAQAMKEAKNAVALPETRQNAIEQARAAERVADAQKDVKDAAQQPEQIIGGQGLEQVRKAMNEEPAKKAEQMLEREAAHARGAEDAAKTPAPTAQEKQNLQKELAAQADTARQAAQSVNQRLGELANQIRPQTPDQQLAQAAQEERQAANELNTNQAPAAEQAAERTEGAKQDADQTAERLALNAEQGHQQAKNADERQKADDKARLAAAVEHVANNEAQKAEQAADQAAQQAAKNAQNAQNAEKDAAQKAQDAAQKLQQLADIGKKLDSPDAKAREEGRKELADVLKQQGEAEKVEAGLQQANKLEDLAKAVQQAENAPNAQAEAQQLAQAEKDLANAENAQNAQQAADTQALAQQMQELAQELKEQAQGEQQAGQQLAQGNSMEQQAREHLKKDAPEIGKELKDAGQKAGQAAQKSQGQPAAQPLQNAAKALPQAGQKAEEAGQQADTAPLGDLAKALEQNAGNVEKSLGEMAQAMAQGEKNAEAVAAGQEARDAAGQQQELANELRQAAGAEQQAHAAAQAASGDREQLENAVKAALGALEKEMGQLGVKPEDVAALQKALAAQQQAEQQAGQQQGGQQEAGQMQASGERFGQMAQAAEQIAQALQAQAAQEAQAAGQMQGEAGQAMEQMAEAQAAAKMGDQAEAQSAAEAAAQSLEQAAESARSQAAGQKPSQGQSQSQSQSQSQGQGKSQQGQKSQSTGQSQSGKGSQASSKGGKAPEPPAGLPIDAQTWNKLPDRVRRDLLNAAGSRFPSEYEASIRRYFKNVAAMEDRK